MKRKFVVILTFFLLLPCIGLSQNTVIDSLKNELKSYQKRDTIRLQILNDLAFYNYSNNPNEALDYADKAARLADEINSIKGKGQSHYMKGITYLDLGNYEVAIDNFQAAIDLFISIDYLKGLAGCNNALGVLFHYQGDLQKAIANFKKAMAIDKELGLEENIPHYLHNIASIYSDLGNYEEAFINYEKALSIYNEKNNQYGKLHCWNAMASAYVEQGNYPQAMLYYNKSLETAEITKDSSSIFMSLHNIGNLYKQQQNYDKALGFYKKALVMEEAKQSLRNVMAIKSSMGGLYIQKQDYINATKLIKESLALSREVGDKDQTAVCLINLGHIYLANEDYPKALNSYKAANDITTVNQKMHELIHSYLGLANVYLLTNKKELALSNVNKAIKLANKHQHLVHKKNAYQILSEIYKKDGNFKKALESYEMYKTLNDSVFNEENIEKITQLEYEYKYKQQIDSLSINELKLTKTIKATSQDLEKSQRNLFLGVITFLVSIIILGGIIFSLKLRHQKAKTQNIAIEQKLLRSQMTPHFIFNSLSVLQGMILNKEDKKSVFYLSKFSKLLRLTLENSRDKLVPLNQELEAVNSYLELQNLEESESYDYTILVDKNIDETLYKIPPMLIQPFIENAIEHAFEDKKENRKIDIQLKCINSELICTIKDNGIGIDAQNGHKRKDKKSLATTITSERLKMLSKDFNIEGSVHIEDRKQHNEQGTIVTLIIPYKKDVA